MNSLELKKYLSKKITKLYFKWKGYGNSFNICIDKKDIVIENELCSRTAQP